MDEILISRIAKSILLGISILGILTGLDIFFGAKVTRLLKRLLDRGTDAVDKALLTPGTEQIGGLLVIVLSAIMLFLLGMIRV